MIANEGGQISWKRNGLVRRVYLSGTMIASVDVETKRPELVTTPKRKAAHAGEVAYWETLRDSDSPTDLQLYLDQFLHRVFAALANRFIAQLENSK